MGEDSKHQPDPAEALANMAESRDEEIVAPPDADEEPADIKNPQQYRRN